jgi:hypothetical protein
MKYIIQDTDLFTQETKTRLKYLLCDYTLTLSFDEGMKVLEKFEEYLKTYFANQKNGNS